MARYLIRISTLVFALLFASGASADFLRNHTDIWAASNGIQLQIIQQGRSIVATGYLYEADRSQTWIIFGGDLATDNSLTASVIQNVDDAPSNNWTSHWSPFVVGSATLRFTSIDSGEFTLTLNGNTTTGTLRRARFANLDLAGTYNYVSREVRSNCSTLPGGIIFDGGSMTVQTNGDQTSMTVQLVSAGSNGVCTQTLPITRRGSVISASGSFVCDGVISGNLDVGTMRVSDNQISLYYVYQMTAGDSCFAEGYLSGYKD